MKMAHQLPGVGLLAGLIVLCPVWTQAQPADPAALWQRATLYRDAWGVPHIEAADVRAMAFAFGATAGGLT